MEGALDLLNQGKPYIKHTVIQLTNGSLDLLFQAITRMHPIKKYHFWVRPNILGLQKIEMENWGKNTQSEQYDAIKNFNGSTEEKHPLETLRLYI